MSIDKNCRKSFPEIWGGIESSINRVGDHYRDQLEYSGHYRRPGDIDLFANLGIRALRYPLLWEYHQPLEQERIDWTYTRLQLEKIRARNVIPIAGLIHHGSGPAYTDLLDPEFPNKFALYARAVAEEFPWIEYYTPVNEPLTTARFSGLYGLWYPHRRSATDFLKMLLHQLKATVLAMREIRKINPGAKLIQTEDLSKTHSTGLLSYQAAFENERRWLTYDLLCGKVDRSHYFWNHFMAAGITESALNFFLENNCPPDIMGFNYYVTSERFLDEKLAGYPPEMHGGNGRHYFADTEAVRTGHMQGIGTLLKEAWVRYGLPIAVTECHLCCSREEQLRWLDHTWHSCCALKKEGVDIRAVTAWALLGAYDWDSLLTKTNLSYEIGVFDNSSGELRPTLLAKMIASLSSTGRYEHPLLGQPGWWCQHASSCKTTSGGCPQAVIVIGGNDAMTQAFAEIFKRRSIPYHIISAAGHDLPDLLKKYPAWAVIDATSVVGAGIAGVNESLLLRDCIATAATCKLHKVRLLTISDIDNEAPQRKIAAVNAETLIARLNAYNIYPDHQLQQMAGTVMDLFIDEEKGFWLLSPEKACKVKSPEKKIGNESTIYYVGK